MKRFRLLVKQRLFEPLQVFFFFFSSRSTFFFSRLVRQTTSSPVGWSCLGSSGHGPGETKEISLGAIWFCSSTLREYSSSIWQISQLTSLSSLLCKEIHLFFLLCYYHCHPLYLINVQLEINRFDGGSISNDLVSLPPSWISAMRLRFHSGKEHTCS